MVARLLLGPDAGRCDTPRPFMAVVFDQAATVHVCCLVGVLCNILNWVEQPRAVMQAKASKRNAEGGLAA